MLTSLSLKNPVCLLTNTWEQDSSTQLDPEISPSVSLANHAMATVAIPQLFSGFLTPQQWWLVIFWHILHISGMCHRVFVSTIAMVSLKLKVPIKRALRSLKMKTLYFKKGKNVEACCYMMWQSTFPQNSKISCFVPTCSITFFFK